MPQRSLCQRQVMGKNENINLLKEIKMDKEKERIVIDQSRNGQVYDRKLSEKEIATLYRKGMEMRESVPIWYKDSNGKYVHIVVSWDRVTEKICKHVDGIELLPDDDTVVVGSIVIQ